MFHFSGNGNWFSGDHAAKFYEAKRFGFSAIELLNWTEFDLPRVAAAIRDAGVALSAILTASRDPAVQAYLNNRHGITHSDAKEPFLTALAETIEAAEMLGVKIIVAVTGNEIPGVAREEQHANVVAALRAASPLLRGRGITLVLEPLNILVNHMGYYLTTTEEAAQIIREVDSPDVRILYDVYHQQITEGNLIANIRKYIDLIGHIHVGDVPGRQEPGSGEINYPNVYRAIRDTGYAGFVTLECGKSGLPLEVVCPRMHAMLPAD